MHNEIGKLAKELMGDADANGKKHWACGNNNASKPKSKKNNATLHVGCKSSDKKKWEKRAAKEGTSLAKLTVKAMNEYCGSKSLAR